MTLDPDRRAALVAAKLGALVRDQWGEAARRPAVLGGGAALVDGTTGWVLADAEPARVLGGAIVWAERNQIDELRVLVDDEAAAGTVARRARAFARRPSVWRVEGRAVRPAVAAPFPERLPAPSGTDELVEMLEAAGVDVVVEHGVLSGEVLGLEIARVVQDEGDGGPRLEVGVGRHDREAFAMIHGRLPTADALAAVVDAVLAQRRPGAPQHPLNRLAAERWLRAEVMRQPQVVGARSLAPIDPTVPRDNVKDAVPAAASGEDDTGGPVVVVCSAGIDLDLVPAAADIRAWHAPDARLVLVVPERDAHPVTHILAATLAVPAEVVAVAGDWREALVRTG